jgi:hypothetical protein
MSATCLVRFVTEGRTVLSSRIQGSTGFVEKQESHPFVLGNNRAHEHSRPITHSKGLVSYQCP